ncbi:hypothetical protein [uncultured Draconibacterium sp.]|uniref:hypothetical protein n=1 Tax=uncultured Draconibacterium sp. TaxID=1573823 RepID=UPI0026196CA4|nr:hypothetical protein [uncultured Draconibacterium sp.]
MNATDKLLKETHNGNLKTLLKIYWSNKPIFKSQYFWTAICVSTLSIIFASLLQIPKFDILKFLAQQATSIIPSVLGFNLGAYIILISLNSTNILKEMTEPNIEEGEKYSFYQKMSSVFAFSLLLQTTSLVFGIIVSTVINLCSSIVIGNIFAEIMNILSQFFLCFVLTYSLVLIGQVVLNVFNFGQVIHFFIRTE